MAYVDYAYAKYYAKLGKHDLFLKAVNSSIETFEKYNDENFILSLLYRSKYLYDTEKLLKTVNSNNALLSYQYALKSKNNLLVSLTSNNLAHFYKKISKNEGYRKYKDSVGIYYDKSYQYAELIKEPVAKKRSLIVYYLNHGLVVDQAMKNTESKSLEAYQNALKLSENDRNFDEYTAMIYNNMGAIFDALGKADMAESYFLKAYVLAKNNTNVLTTSYKIQNLDNLSIFYKNQNRIDQAFMYERESNNVYKQESEKQLALTTKSLELFYETQKKNQQIHKLIQDKKVSSKQKLLFLGIIILSIISIIILLYLIYIRKKLNAQKTDTLRSEQKEIKLELELERINKARLEAEQELLHLKQMQLQKGALVISLQLDHKNSVLSDLKGNLKDENNLSIKKILKEEELVNNDFEEIQNMIQKLHPEFFKRLKEVSKVNLTILDLKYAAYIYMNMDNLQIATILKVDPKTVSVTKYRLKQKLGLNKEEDLLAFIQNLS